MIALALSALLFATDGVESLPEPEEDNTLEARTAQRFHVTVAGGTVNNLSGGTGTRYGVLLAVGKPLWLGTRWPHHQWVLDTLVLAGFAPATQSAHVALSPTWGLNWYFGKVFGLEWRVGVGFASRLSNNSVLGLGWAMQMAAAFRFFADDRIRIKAGMVSSAMLPFWGPTVVEISGGYGLSFEMPVF